MKEITTKWKILCSTHKACPKIIDELIKMGFQKVKDTPKSPTSDISAMAVVLNEKKIKKTAKALFKKYGGDIQRISITTI